MTLVASCFLTPAALLILNAVIVSQRLRNWVGPIFTFSFLGWLFSLQPDLNPTERLLCCSLWLFYFIKGWSLLKIPHSEAARYSTLGLLLFAYLWPGVDPKPFAYRESPDPKAARWFVFGFPTMCLGIALLVISTLLGKGGSEALRGLTTVACLLTIIHLGYSDILSSGMRLLGFPVNRLFHFPLASRSLNDFWTHRWNRPFVEMNRLIFQPLLRPLLGRKETVLALFLLSGLLHELALSYPVGAGYGGPLLYFVLQGAGMLMERRLRLRGRLWTWAVVFLPMPLLFHSALREALIAPIYQYLGGLPQLESPETFLQTMLWFAGYGHFLVLVASFQVPHRLNWAEELQRLRPLNRKLLWTYGGYIATFIFLWGVLTLNLIPEFLAGDKCALVLLFLIALFWWSRIIVDALYFKHSDWPEGVEFVLGHTMLTTLFVTLAGTYTAVLLRHFKAVFPNML